MPCLYRLSKYADAALVDTFAIFIRARTPSSSVAPIYSNRLVVANPNEVVALGRGPGQPLDRSGLTFSWPSRHKPFVGKSGEKSAEAS